MRSKFFLIIYFVPVIFAYLFEFIFQEFNLYRLYNLMENILFYTFTLIIIQFLKNENYRRIVFFFSFSALVILTWFESVFYYLYGINFNSSTVYILTETNLNEVSEFINTYINDTIRYFSLIMLISFIVIFYFSQKKDVYFISFLNVSATKKILSVLSISIIYFGILKFTLLIVHNTPYLFVKASIQYLKDSKKFDLSNTNHITSAFKNVCKDTIGNEETYVFIIGESTTKNKMSLYGYQKHTNPKLNEIRNELFVFDNVISPHTHTIASLSKSLTLNNHQNPSKTNNGSIIQLMNAAGFKTYWLSNQKPIGLYENLITKISKGAYIRKFINIAEHNKKTPYDHQLLKPLKIALNDTVPKKAIFIHLLGTHLKYDKRYPKEFNYFPTSDLKDKKEELINQYDNAVRYNDFVVREIIEEVKAKNVISYVLYFSDHGEEVYYDKEDFYGHYEEDPTPSMYEIPFILWTSVKYRKLKKPEFNIHNKFMTDELIHSVSDISGIWFSCFDRKKSLFDSSYINKPRMVRKNVSYEELFLKDK